ncbi:hypothetical protein BRADI_2g09042v3 [Brachypodium distachyon]|uniref:Phytocyanin domain-containing protein n=1 Tax=Brachypodium distachyon TaxID=15368 RepID=A0A2K2D7L9_BRADI|nr:hypothetical protein BRADI_2g09042v3 [Brachypodium distachyon]
MAALSCSAGRIHSGSSFGRTRRRRPHGGDAACHAPEEDLGRSGGVCASGKKRRSRSHRPGSGGVRPVVERGAPLSSLGSLPAAMCGKTASRDRPGCCQKARRPAILFRTVGCGISRTAHQCSSSKKPVQVLPVVGDSNGWTFGVMAWPNTPDKRFRVGDVLGTLHNVVMVDSFGFATCTRHPDDATVYSSGNDRITLSSSGVIMFICGKGEDHCYKQGMKIAVTVRP